MTDDPLRREARERERATRREKLGVNTAIVYGVLISLAAVWLPLAIVILVAWRARASSGS